MTKSRVHDSSFKLPYWHRQFCLFRCGFCCWSKDINRNLLQIFVVQFKETIKQGKVEERAESKVVIKKLFGLAAGKNGNFIFWVVICDKRFKLKICNEHIIDRSCLLSWCPCSSSRMHSCFHYSDSNGILPQLTTQLVVAQLHNPDRWLMEK